MCPEVDSLVRQLAAGKGEFFDYVDDSHRAGKDEAFTCVYSDVTPVLEPLSCIFKHFHACSPHFEGISRHFESLYGDRGAGGLCDVHEDTPRDSALRGQA